MSEGRGEVPRRRQVHWRKSSRSGEALQCVEVAMVDGAVLVRNSRHPVGPVLRFTHGEWEAFLDGVHAGEFETRQEQC
jgi:hypothetical protein